MLPALLKILGIATTWLTRVGIAVFAINEFRKFYNDNETTLAGAQDALNQAGVTEDEQQQLVSALTYEKVESEGKDVDGFWKGLTEKEKEALKFSPQSLRTSMDRTSFLGLASIVLFASALVAGGIGAIRGMPVVLSTLSKMRTARASGASALQLVTIAEEGKIAAIAKVWAPAVAATFLGASGWWSSTMSNSFNDADLWGRIFLGQAEQDIKKAESSLDKDARGSGTGRGAGSGTMTIIRMVEEKKPEQFIGTLFSAKLGNPDQFERKVDDEITDMEDLTADVKLNLNRWLKSLPGRMGYSIVVRKDPVDEYGSKQSGIWATLTLFITHISGKTTPIDTILLGPVNPATRLELTKQTKTIENQIPDMIDATEVREIQVPSGTVDIFNAQGERITPSGTTEPTPTEADFLPQKYQRKTGESDTEYNKRLEEGVKDLEATVEKQRKKVASASGTPGKNTTPDDIKPYKQSKVFTGDGSNLNMRKNPGLTGAIVGKIPDGTLVTRKGGVSVAKDGYNWVIISPPGGDISKDYWVAVEFLRPV